MSDFNQPTRKQNAQTPSVTPPSGQQTRQTDQGSIERNPDAPADGDAVEPEVSHRSVRKDDAGKPGR